jgi:HD-GYP domain-containing protein (c-di-GMP phosphodiesterase class II)
VVGSGTREPPGSLRLAELLASVSLATDLGTGQPLGHALRTCTLATALARAMGCGDDDVRTVHQFALLRFLGCTSDAADTAAEAGGDDLALLAAMAPAYMGSGREKFGRFVRSLGPGQPVTRRLRLVARALADPDGERRSLSTHCEVGTMLAARIGLAQPVVEALAHAYERWDGKGFPDGLTGEAIPLAVRIGVVARDAALAGTVGVDPHRWMLERRGDAYDPSVVDALERLSEDAVSELENEWESVLRAEPEPATTVSTAELDAVLAAFADFADLKSPWIRGHSRKVASLAEEAGRVAGLDIGACDSLRRAGLVHDVGRTAIANGIWDKPGPLTTSESEQVRLHVYYTERILARCPPLASLVEPAWSHHERVDGSGYHRSLAGDALSRGDRILAAADVFAALTAERPHRPAFSDDDAARILEDAGGRILDADATACVLAAAGKRAAPAPQRWPADLSDREVDVLRLIARGLSNREVAERLFISRKTVGRHVENLYRKIDVSSRAAAALFAMQHDLLD